MTRVLGESKRSWTVARLFCESRAVMVLLRSTQLTLGRGDTIRGLWTLTGTHRAEQSLGIILIEDERSSVQMNKM